MSEDFHVHATGLRKSFGALHAVDGISFHVRRGECYGFLGPNGAGKTTTIRMLHGAVRPDAGDLRVLDFKMPQQARLARERMGIVSQEDTLDRELTVRQNLWVFAMYHGISRRDSRSRIDSLLDFVQLGDKVDAQIKVLSGGMKRRLHIARALLHQPQILVLDEPTTGLDPQARHLVWQRLRELRRQGLTILLTTHYMEEAAQLCDRISVIDEGKFLVEGGPAELVEAHVGEEVLEFRGMEEDEKNILSALEGLPVDWEHAGDTLYVYCRNGTPIMERLISSGRSDFIRRPASLEDLFLRLTGREIRE
ncbi:MAG: ATP-binding cassette domain-containing protein [bacterium]|nr:ATP-binding cassette domain-containing protein [bacterium]